MKRAMEHLQDLSQDEEVRRWEEAREKFIRDQRAEKAYAFDEGMEKGMQKGMEKGMEKGRAEGMEEVALNMLKSKFKLSVISKITGLSEAEIEKLKNSF